MRRSTLSFAEKHFLLDGVPFARERIPPIINPLNTMDERQACTFMLLVSIQSFKTLCATLHVGASSILRPSRTGWYSQSGDAVEDWAEEKLNPFYEENELLRRVLRTDKQSNLKLRKGQINGFLLLLSAHTLINRQSKSLETIITDEAWAYEAGELTEIQGRYAAFEKTYRHIIPSTGWDKNSESDLMARDAEWRQWHVPCDACGEPMSYDFFPPPKCEPPERINDRGEIVTIEGKEFWQPWGGLRMQTGESIRTADGGINWPAFHGSIFYQCPHCGHRHADSDTAREARNLRAVDAWSNREDGHEGYLTTKPGKHDIVLWNANSLAFMSWKKLGELWLTAMLARERGDAKPFEDFHRKRIPHPARPWSVRMVATDIRKSNNKGDYAIRELWPEGKYGYMAIDWQKDHWWWAVRFFRPDGKSRLIDCGKLISPDHLREKQHLYKIPDYGSAANIALNTETNRYELLAPCRVFIDGNYHPDDVRRLAARYHWIVLRGQDAKEFTNADGVKVCYDRLRLVDAYEQSQNSPLERYCLEVYFANNPARNLFAGTRSMTEPETLWTYPHDVPAEYLEHLDAWSPQIRTRKKDGSEYVNWEREAKRDDLFWCEKAIIVGAAMNGLIGASAITAPAVSEPIRLSPADAESTPGPQSTQPNLPLQPD